MVPDLDDLSVVAEAEDVHAGELGVLATWRRASPTPCLGSRCCPSRRNQIILREHEIDSPAKVGEGFAELRGNPGLPASSRFCLGRPEIVTHVVVGEDLVRERCVSVRPNFVVEPKHETLVRLRIHLSRS